MPFKGPSLNSVVQMTKGRTRDDALTELKNKENPKEKERCKRLFGHLMGTLNSIKKDAEKSSNDPQNITRLKIEKKVEAGNKLINETIQKEQNELLRSKRERQNDLKILNQRYRAAEAFDRWRNEKEKMKGFIRTTKTPFVFYRPRIVNEEAQLRIDQTTREIDAMIDTRKKKLESEIIKAVKYSELHLEGHGARGDAAQLAGDARGGRDSTGELGGAANHHGDDHHSTVGGASTVGKKGRGRSPADSFASEEEDYEDMIEEIEISMHDETTAVHEDEPIHVVMDTGVVHEDEPMHVAVGDVVMETGLVAEMGDKAVEEGEKAQVEEGLEEGEKRVEAVEEGGKGLEEHMETEDQAEQRPEEQDKPLVEKTEDPGVEEPSTIEREQQPVAAEASHQQSDGETTAVPQDVARSQD